ncbi:hypothetical protein [Nostoc sp. UHCC 0870]|uniref:hypothetical protein n=1 Tax=Nostoc sp. UHCC 0870 TaxID=2914041 RepID=UPI0030DC8E48
MRFTLLHEQINCPTKEWDLVLYLPDKLVRTFRLQYEFATTATPRIYQRQDNQ